MKEITVRFRMARADALTLAGHWLERGLDPAQAQAFWDIGFGPYDHGLVALCLDHGLEAGRLRDQARGRDAVRRLRGGEAVSSVLARLNADR